MRWLIALTCLGCGALESLPEHETARKYPLACVETTQNGGDAPRRLVREFAGDQIREVRQLNADGAVESRTTYHREPGTVTAVTERAGAKATRVTRSDGQRILSWQEGAVTVRFEWLNGRLEREVDTRPTGEWITTYRYAAGHLAEKVRTGPDGTHKTQYLRDEMGQTIRTTSVDGSVRALRSVTELAGRTRTATTYRDGALLQRVRTTLDGFGNPLTAVTRPTNAPPRRTTFWYGCWPGV